MPKAIVGIINASTKFPEYRQNKRPIRGYSRDERTLTTITLNVLDGATEGEDFQIITNKVEAAGYFTELLASNDFVYAGNEQANKVKELFDQITSDQNAGLNSIDEFFCAPENNQLARRPQAVAVNQVFEFASLFDAVDDNGSADVLRDDVAVRLANGPMLLDHL